MDTLLCRGSLPQSGVQENRGPGELALDSPEGRKPVQRMPSQRVDSKPVLGGLHHEYRWAA